MGWVRMLAFSEGCLLDCFLLKWNVGDVVYSIVASLMYA